MLRTKSYCSAVCIFFLLGTSSSFATIIAYEGFSYTPGLNLSGRNGGVGFSSAWSGSTTNYTIGPNSLIAPPIGGVPTTGNRVIGAAIATGATSFAAMTRDLFTSLGAAGNTNYFSFLIQPGEMVPGSLGGSFISLALASNAGGGTLFFGVPGVSNNSQRRYAIENLGGGGRVFSNVNVIAGQSALLVVRADFNPNPQLPDTFTFFVNPTPGLPEPSLFWRKTDLNLLSVDRLFIQSSGAFSIDEIRVGTTFADVVPVPEPTSAMIFGLSGISFAYFSQRKRRMQLISPLQA